MTTTSRLSRRGFLGQAAAVGAAAAAGSLLTDALTRRAYADGGPGWQIGCFTRPWAAYDYRTAMDAIAEAGLKYVGLMTAKTSSGLVLSVKSKIEEAVEASEQAKRRGLEIACAYCGEVGLASRRTAATELRHLIDLAAASGAKTLLICSGVGQQTQHELYCGAIADCCDYAAEKKLGLAMKPHGGLNATGPDLRKVVEKIHHKNFTVWYDAGNILNYSDGRRDPVADAAAIDGLVTGWCIKDFRQPKQVYVTPGEGQVDFRAVMARLKKGGFTGGPLLIETLAPGDLPHLLAEAKKARRFLEKLVGQ